MGNESEIAYTAIEQLGKKNVEDYNLAKPYPTSAAMFEFKTQRVWEKKDATGKEEKEIERSDLEAHAIHFIRNRCKQLRFKKDPEHMALKDKDGKSLKARQIPYNVEMDLDRRCLEMAIHRFMESGVAKDAFDVYYIYLEMFIGAYGETKKMIEMLSEFETNASSLLMKHRDHYSHSVYVFLIGLAYYDSSENFRYEYRKKYESYLQDEGLLDDEEDVAAHFLKYWGLTALFHDIGYPFELSFEQVKSYFGNTIDYVPFVTYNMNNYVNCEADDHVPVLEAELAKMKLALQEHPESLDEKKKAEYEKKIESYPKEIKKLKEAKESGIKKIEKLVPKDMKCKIDGNINAYLASVLEENLSDSYIDSKMYAGFVEKRDYKKSVTYGDYLYDVMTKRNDPQKCGGFIDHAYYSAVMLTINLLKAMSVEELTPMYSNAIIAILLHNSFYKYAVTNVKSGYNDNHHFTVSQNPLAFLLMLCDEVQCWDRTSYGRNSRGQVHPMNCRLTFDGDKIDAVYIFDAKYATEVVDANSKKSKYVIKKEYANVGGTYKKISGENEFLKDIEDIISINGDTSFGKEAAKTVLTVSAEFEKDTRYRRTYLSSSNFIHLYTFAYMVHQMNHINDITVEDMEKKFNELSLEYKMSHIGRAKKYARYLNEIGCFYSDKPLDFEVVTKIEEKIEAEEKNVSELDTIGALEHDRWCFDHYIMGWKYGEDYLEFENSGEVRERTRIHKDMIQTEIGHYDKKIALEHYEKDLNDDTRNKDKVSMNNLLKLLDREDGIKVYRLGEANK